MGHGSTGPDDLRMYAIAKVRVSTGYLTLCQDPMWATYMRSSSQSGHALGTIRGRPQFDEKRLEKDMAHALFDRYLDLERIILEADERGDEPFADSLRDLMDSIWYQLSVGTAKRIKSHIM